MCLQKTSVTTPEKKMVYNADFSVSLYYFNGIQRMLALLVWNHLPENLFVFGRKGCILFSNPATSLLSEHIKDSIRYRECLIWAQKPQIFPDPQYFNWEYIRKPVVPALRKSYWYAFIGHRYLSDLPGQTDLNGTMGDITNSFIPSNDDYN